MKYDLVIIGSGILGTFAAYHALNSGKKVALIEGGKSPKGSSVRNFGQVVPSGLSLQGWRSLGIRSLEIYKQLANALNINIQNNGSMYLASDNDEEILIHELNKLDLETGYPSQLLTAEQCLERLPGLSKDYVKSGLFYSNEISVDSESLIHAVLQALKSNANFDYLLSKRAVSIENNSDAVITLLSDGTPIKSQDLLICCGYQLNTLMSQRLQIPSMAIARLQMLATSKFPANTIKGNLLTGLSVRRYESFHSCKSYENLKTPAHLQKYVDQGIHILFKQAANREIIIGDSHHYHNADECDSLDYSIDQSVNDLILEEARRIFPHFNIDINRTWNGYYSQENNKGLLAETIDSHIHLLTGIGGKGMTSGPALMENVIGQIFSRHPLSVETLIPQTTSKI